MDFKNIFSKFSWILRNKKYNKFGYPVLENVNNDTMINNKKSALLVYRVEPFIFKENYQSLLYHTSLKRSKFIAKMLGEFGYLVDVVNYNDSKYKLNKEYDLVIGLGKTIEKIIPFISDKAIKIFLSTGSEANFYNQKITERVNYVNKIKNCELKPDRINEDNSDLLKYYNNLICLGTEYTASTYSDYFNGKTYIFNNHGHDELSYYPENKFFKYAKKNFLFFTGRGKILNGLDLLLEVFKKRPDLNLYVAGSFNSEKEFKKCFKNELYNTKNIHAIGWVGIGDKKFDEIIKKCAMVIVPICAGASHGSVVTCMNYGLIPVVSKEAGIDTEDFGITFSSYEETDIIQTVDWLSKQPTEWFEDKSKKTYATAKEKFSEKAFNKKFKEILTDIIINNGSNLID